MKTKVLFAGLVAFILGMILVAVIMSDFLFTMSVEEPKKPAAFTAIQPEPEPEDTEPEEDSAKKPSAPVVIDAAKTGKTVPPPKKPAPKPPRVRDVNINQPVITAAPEQRSESAKSSSDAKVTMIIGSATAMQPDSATRMLRMGSAVNPDDTIETLASSRLEITFSDGTVIKLGENCRISMEEYCFDQTAPEKTGFAMKVFKGSCRVMTGLVTKINPSRFKVKSRMATVGIRGCDVAIKAQPKKESIYTLELSGPERVVINTTKEGRTVMDRSTGKQKEISPADSKEILVSSPMTVVTLEDGAAPIESNMSSESLKDVTQDTSALEPASFEMISSPGGTTLMFNPKKTGSKGQTE